MRTLSVTSPLTHNDHVKEAQKKLAGDNVFKANYKPGEIDGQFGEGTGRACKRAKYWLGYPLKEMKPIYGEVINDYLSGKKKLPPTYRTRRNDRLKASQVTPIRDKALHVAVTNLGYKESPPGSNMTKFGAWYGLNHAPWCAMFVTFCYVQVNSKAFAKGSRYAYVPYIVANARAGRYNIAITHDPLPGDLVCYDWEGNGVADHVGLFEKWLNKAQGTFQAVEGNTSVGNDSNGGEVMRRERKRSQVQAFVHVGG